MKSQWFRFLWITLVLISVIGGLALWKPPALAQAARTKPLIIDHTTRDITAIPQSWIEKAKTDLRIYYGHTSHGSQLVSGMNSLVAFANAGGKGLALPNNIFSGLSVTETSPDAGYYPDWVNTTRSYLGTPNTSTGRGSAHPAINVVIWSWCGQVSGITSQNLLNQYLLPMTQLEADYPGITFVYMTGHSDGSGETGNLHLRNQQIRQYALTNNKVLYDFYDIELYNPDGAYFGNKAVNDGCYYDSDGNGSRDKNWCTDWQATHTQNKDWYSVDCAHSEAINCNQKAYAAWWLWASLAGWNAPANLTSSSKTVNQLVPALNDTITYTIRITNSGDTLLKTVYLTDTLPTGLNFIPGSLTASAGSVDASHAPTLYWSGVLNPSPTVTITYAAKVTAAQPTLITNSAQIQVAGEPAITRSASIVANGHATYLPAIVR